MAMDGLNICGLKVLQFCKSLSLCIAALCISANSGLLNADMYLTNLEGKRCSVLLR